MQAKTSKWRVALGAALLTACAFAAHADDAVEKTPFLGGFLQRTDVVYPVRVGEWETLGEKRFDQAEAGASVRYARKDDESGWIDVFFYPLGVVDKERERALAENERLALVESWRDAMRDPNDITDLASVSIGKPVKKPEDAMPAYAVDFAFDHDGVPSSSAMVVAVYNMYGVKFRYTVDAKVRDRAQAREALVQFARTVFTTLDIDSNGACWLPMPIEQLDEGAEAPNGVVFKTDVDGKPSTWVTADRVLARDPTSMDAAMAQMLGRAIAMRDYEGCSEPSDVQRTAPKGMRVLRLEYTPPGEKNGPGERLRPARSGVG